MQTIEASFEIVTPMFIGGGNPNDVELRPPSIKGALRFWWRALHWGQCLQDAQLNLPGLKDLAVLTPEALKLLHEREAALFGAAAKTGTDYGQGLFFIKLKPLENSALQNTWPKNNDEGAGYLGYGLDRTRDHAHRQAIETTMLNPETKAIEPAIFYLSLVLKKGVTEEQKAQLKQTLKLWGLLGGLGSRARRGFGSVNLIALDNEPTTFANQETYSQTIKDLLNIVTLAPAMPIFTALNKATQIVVLNNNKNYTNYKPLMDEVGRQYKEARISVSGLNRVVFGLPLEGLRGRADIINRRSSPLLLHIHKFDVGYIAVFSFIPAQFHPQYPKGKQLAFYETLDSYMKTMTRIYP
jgi:CRISPR-associated protein Cmr1